MSGGALGLETIGLTKRFGDFTALDAVDLKVAPGTVHALLGENGAGKSTLVKCLVGYYRADAGSILVDDREVAIGAPQDARAIGIGMVYQHFTLVPSMTVAENLSLARGDLPMIVHWKQRHAELERFMATTPFQLPLDAPVSSLSAGQKQKTEILKQLYADSRFVILDEPTSVLTPEEADEVLGAIRDLAHAGQVTALLITHKFREVNRFADDVTVLRRGRLIGSSRVADTDTETLARQMVGDGSGESAGTAAPAGGRPAIPTTVDQGVVLSVSGLAVHDDRGMRCIDDLHLTVRGGEILGIAGVSGNGQREFLQALTGQRPRAAGRVEVNGEPFAATHADYHRLKVAALPEEPLSTACVPRMSVGDNLILRSFDRGPIARVGMIGRGRVESLARRMIAEFRIKTRGPAEEIALLSGGNVQRCVLARELSQDARVMLVMNPTFGLDFAAVREIHGRLLDARASGCAILLIGEDLDELLELSDRVLVMSQGRFVFESTTPRAERDRIGHSMGGHAVGMADAA